MKILVVCQHYWPEPFRLADICEELTARGHTVHVLTGVPNYPAGRIFPEYTRGQNRGQLRNGVKIHRSFTIGRRNNLLFRVLNYYSFALSAVAYERRMVEEFDVVLAYQSSPVMMAWAALDYGKRHRIPVLLYSMDLWPNSLHAGGITSESPIYRYYHKVSERIYRGADQVVVSSRGFSDYLSGSLGVEPERLSYLPQYADHCFEPGLVRKSDGLNLVFAGNVGVAQNLSVVLEAAGLLKGKYSVRWHIVGMGSELEHLRKMAAKAGLDNVLFHGYQSGDALKEFYQMADAMLITMTEDPVLSLTLPMKIMSYLASGKPVIASANGEIANVIRDADCGYCAGAGDAAGLAEAVCAFVRDPRRETLGENARRYYETHFTRERFMDELERKLRDLAERGRT